MSTHSRIGTVVATVVVLLVLSVAAGFAFIYSGIYNVSAASKDNPIIAWALHRTYEASLHRYGGKDSPPADLMSLDNIRAGARMYDSTCALCHGAPDRTLSPVGQGIQPSAPQLLAATRRNNPPLMFWVIKHGVNMTAMPSFGKTQSDDTIWKLAAFLYKGRGITKDQYDALKSAN
ncbi:c-type cytochrome [Paraburkholderia rhizosphaerae]|uniref:Cbb3-type cytochrome c oxidase subunit III n=1 Tax=Paraburkholderia rhizosphaerae TaxID=480658 RepID=A0A4R8LV00_9BURK|nr:cytochrome c [Paraburkholderia rhizosphaerae]TDY51534.1 cbb3-type cytochrome c oxidase subunit III [Paraburkholderia rhizosphaerae]